MCSIRGAFEGSTSMRHCVFVGARWEGERAGTLQTQDRTEK